MAYNPIPPLDDTFVSSMDTPAFTTSLCFILVASIYLYITFLLCFAPFCFCFIFSLKRHWPIFPAVIFKYPAKQFALNVSKVWRHSKCKSRYRVSGNTIFFTEASRRRNFFLKYLSPGTHGHDNLIIK